ncbi:MAG: UDP-N-acetylglucosamine 2-epimerase (hydrolyzing) [Hyphomicrobium sp.]|nr:UDP-N-acetylglucosamine 2-epimerase (hydrolyzing) [Hyphomicrobium sp.]
MKCAIVTTSRADYGLLKSPMTAIREHAGLTLQTIVSGTHLAPSHGRTISEIENDGFKPDWLVDLIIDSPSKVSRAYSMGLGLIGFATAFEHLSPDIVVVLGDRFEMFAAASAAVVMGLPIAHIAGGDVTEGAYDDSFRHGISKAASLHFATNPEAATRLRQMGEPEDRIHMVGSPGLDGLNSMQWMTADAVRQKLGLKSAPPHCPRHIPSRDPIARRIRREVTALCAAIRQLPSDVAVVITGTNADTGSEEVRQHLEALARERDNVVMRASLGHELYLNALRIADAVVGNSSSGLYEAPSLQTATVNIGDRQKGRPKAASVIDVAGDSAAISAAIARAFALDCSKITSPYGNGGAGQRIAHILAAIETPSRLIIKPFADLAAGAR